MPCTVVNSQSNLQARLPSLPQNLPRAQGDWIAVLNALNAWGQILKQESHAPNVIPSQFQTFTTTAASAVTAALTAVNCTPSVDGTTQYYGGASLKIVIGATGATLTFSGYPISIAAATRWFGAFQILAPAGCTGSLAVKTSAGHAVTESFTVPASASWQQVWGLFDLRAYADTQATWTLTFTSTATVWLDGMQQNAVGDPLSNLPRFAGTQMVTGDLAYASNLDGVPDGSTYLRMPGANMDGNRRGLVDFSQSGHIGKTLDNIGDGSSFRRVSSSYVDSSNRPLSIFLPDTRTTNQLPSWYRANYPQRIVAEFKQVSAIGVPSAATYCGLHTKIPWIDTSGGVIVQEVNAQDGVWVRRGSADDSSWGTWFKSYDSQNKPDLDSDVLDGSTYLRMPGANMDGNRRAIIDLSQGHLNTLTATKLGAGTLNSVISVGAGQILYDNGSVMRVTGTGFGSSNQFVDWFGPHLASIASCTESNATWYLKTDGSAYFGGALSAGTLTTKAATSDTSSTAVAETATFGSNGGTISIVTSYNFDSNPDGSNGSGSNSCTIQLYRNYAGGGYVLAATYTATGTWNVSGGTGDSSCSGSFTFTDPNNSTSTRQYKAVISSRACTILSPNVSQQLSVICTE